MSKVVHKFATGQPIPDGAVYLNTVTQTSIETQRTDGFGDRMPYWNPCWLVWHYFLVEASS